MVISNKYEVLERLGLGGMGTVFKVRHTTLETIHALKVLAPNWVEDAGVVERFRREARMIARFNHPNIVRVSDIDRDAEKNMTYIVMEWIRGRTLAQHLKAHRGLPFAELDAITRQVASALAYAHGHEPPVIHRDVKPANVMLEDGTQRAVVMDFGIAKEVGGDDHTKAGDVLGTVKYCPPEQLRGEELTPSADVYALGMVIYEMHTGTHLFAGMENTTIIGKLLDERVENEPEFDATTPAPLADLIRRAIAKDPAARTRTMQALLEELESVRVAIEGPGPARPSPPTGRGADTVVLPTAAAGRRPEGKQSLDTIDRAQADDDAWVLGDAGRPPPDPPSPTPLQTTARGEATAHVPPSDVAAARRRGRSVRPASLALIAGVVLVVAAWWSSEPTDRTPPAAPAGPDVVAPAAGVGRAGAPDPIVRAPAARERPTDRAAAGPPAADRGAAPGAAAAANAAPAADAAPKVAAAPRDERAEDGSPTPLPPANAAPQIAGTTPAGEAVTARSGETLAFAVEAEDPDGDPLTYEWSLDGKPAGTGPELDLLVAEPGSHALEVEVADPSGGTAATRWQIDVPAPPRIARATPAGARLTLAPEEVRLFAVQVAGDGEPLELRHVWRVGGRQVGSAEVYEFVAPATGTHEVHVAIRTVAGDELGRRWTVDVRDDGDPTADTPGPRPAPAVVAVELDQTPTPDRKNLSVVGSVQNVDQASADNVVVWVSALDQAGAVLLRRAALPMPQPLPPQANGTYELALPNLDAIDRFKVEVLSR